MSTHGSEAEAETAERYRTEAAEFRAEARAAQAAGDENRAYGLLASAYDLSVLAASVERSVRGLPPLPPTSLEGRTD